MMSRSECSRMLMHHKNINNVTTGHRKRMARQQSAFVSPKILARKGGVDDRVKIILTSSFITMQNLVAVSHPVCAYRLW